MASSLKALIFDFNGTLFWDSNINFRAWDRCVQRWFNRPYTQKEYRQFNGRTAKETVVDLYNNNISEENLNILVEEEVQDYFDVCANEKALHLAPHIEQLISFAKENNLICAVATSATDYCMDRYFCMFDDLKKFFTRELIICNNGNFKSKPEPDIYTAVLKKLNIKPDECVVFEDTASGLQSAYSAGIKNLIAITGDNTSKLETDIPFLAEIKDYSMNSYDPLKEILTRLINKKK